MGLIAVGFVEMIASCASLRHESQVIRSQTLMKYSYPSLKIYTEVQRQQYSVDVYLWPSVLCFVQRFQYLIYMCICRFNWFAWYCLTHLLIENLSLVKFCYNIWFKINFYKAFKKSLENEVCMMDRQTDRKTAIKTIVPSGFTGRRLLLRFLM